MSQENVELVRRAVESMKDRRVPDELLSPDFRTENVRTAVTKRTYVGAAGAHQWMDDFLGMLDETARLDIEENLADGDDCVVTRVGVKGRASRSGLPLELRWVTVWWIRDGQITRAVGYAGRREALEAVGLRG